MTLAFLIYIVALLPSLSTFFFVAMLAFIFSLPIILLLWSDYGNDENKPMFIKFIKRAIFGVVFCGVMTTIIPKEKTAWWMLGGYAAQTVYQSEEGTKYRQLIMQKIDEAITEKTK